MGSSHRIAGAAFVLSAGALLAFVLVPLMAILIRVPPGQAVAQLGSGVALDALAVSLKTATIALAVILLIGTPAAYLLGTRKFRGSGLIATLLELPLVLPPAVAGIALFAALGRFGLLGGALRAFGVEIPFTQAAVVLALTFVALPFYVRQAIAAFASLDPDTLAASRTLGARRGETFLRIAVPLARKGLSAGAALAFARALGEFGATIMFAGSFRGTTQTLPLAIYGEFGTGNLDGALAMSALLIAVSVVLLVGVKLAVRSRSAEEPPWTMASRSTSGTA